MERISQFCDSGKQTYVNQLFYVSSEDFSVLKDNKFTIKKNNDMLK